MFLKQLAILLWKNAILKRRQPVLLALELLWPVFLFGVILAPLRVRFAPLQRNETMYRATALPSAGVLPFMQSVVCDLSGGRSDFSSDMPYYPNATVNKLYEILDDVALWNGSWSSVCPTLSTTVDVSDACISAFTLELSAQQVLGTLPTNPEDLLPPECLSLRQHYEQVDRLLALNEFTALYPRLANTTLEGQRDSMQRFLCGDLPVNSAAFEFLNRRVFLGDKTQQAMATNITSTLRAKRQNAAPTGTTPPPSTPSPRTAPKVLYYARPEFAPLARAIIRRANRTFESVEYIKNWAEQVLNCSEYFLEHFPPGSPEVAQVVQLVSLFNDSRSTQAKLLLDPSNPQNIWVAVGNAANISQAVLDTIASFDWDIFIPAPSEDQMSVLAGNYTLQHELNITTVIGGVVMENFELDSVGQLQSVDIRVRLNSTYIPATDVLRQSVYIPGPENGQLRRLYLLGGFVFLQDMMERAAMEYILGHTMASPGTYIHQMPYPCYNRNQFTESMIVVLPIAMTLAWIFSVAITVRAIVLEKELRLKEVMRMMGLGDGALRLSWYLTSLAVLVVSVAIIAVVLKVSGIVLVSNGVILWLYLMLYACSMISYCFLLSVFFNSANLAACISALVYFMFFFAEITIIAKQKYLSGLWIAAFSLSAPVAFSIGSSYMMQLEILETGLQWSSLNVQPTQENHFTFLGVCGMLALDTVLYYVLAWYLEAVFPGRYGVAKRWHFFLQPSFWLGQRYSLRRWWATDHAHYPTADVELECLAPGMDDLCCEQEPELKAGIEVENLSKVYSSGTWWSRKHVKALNGFSLKFYEGQITALLGHNGAGKTTTMSLLTGLFEPSSGTAHVYGCDIRTQMDLIRQSLGVCPQFNVLFDSLTVEEHMIFYGQLKGLSRDEIRKQIPIWLSKINLSCHSKTLSKHLSGGMKRKLSIMMAFLGDPRTVILDEPTSGVDPFARRQIWDFLCRHRSGHTLILSTHHMDEAEILGDRIAIIASGRLLCCGSFEYLKSRFGHGHHLVLVRSCRGDGLAEPCEPSVNLDGFTGHDSLSVLTDPAKPADTVGSTDSVGSTDPVGPTNPAKPADPIGPTDPSKQADSVRSTDPVGPTDPVGSTDPAGHTDSTGSVKPLSVALTTEKDMFVDTPDTLHPPQSTLAAKHDKPSGDDSMLITTFIQGLIPDTSLEEVRGQELHYLLPLKQAQPAVLARLFRQLEEAKVSLDVSSYGLTSCSLDEIFVELTGEQQKHPGDIQGPRDVSKYPGGMQRPRGVSTDVIEEHATSGDEDDRLSGPYSIPSGPYSIPPPASDGSDGHTVPDCLLPAIKDHPDNLSSEPPAVNERQPGSIAVPGSQPDLNPASPTDETQLHSGSRHQSSFVRIPATSPITAHPCDDVSSPISHTEDSSPISVISKPTDSIYHDDNDGIALLSSEEDGGENIGIPNVGSSEVHTVADVPDKKGNIEIEIEAPAVVVHTATTRAHSPPKCIALDGLGTTRPLTGLRLWHSQYHALLVKRARYTQRKLLASFVQSVLPLAVVLTSLVISYILLDVENPPPLQLTPSLFFQETPDNYAFVGGLGTGATASYRAALFRPCGVGLDISPPSTAGGVPPRCANRTVRASASTCDGDTPPILPCRCSSCRGTAQLITPSCYNGTRSGSRLLDLTLGQTDLTEAHLNLTSYLLRTEMSYAQRRYGGLSFGHERPEVSDFLDGYFSEYPNTSLPFLAVRRAAKAWYSNKGYHSVPAYVNTLNNAILRAHLDPSKDPTVHGVRTFSHPFPTTELQKLQYAVLQLGASIVDPLGAVFAIGFIVAGFVLLIIEERSGKVKHLQVASGLSRTVYWLSCFTWDLCAYALVTGFILFLYLAFQDPNFTSADTLPSFVLLLVSYGVAVTPWMYVLSFVFDSPATGYIVLFCLNFFSGFCLLIVDIIIVYITEATTTNYFLVYAPFPAYHLGRGMVYLNLDRVIKKVLATLSGDKLPGAVDDLWPFVASLWVQGCVYTVLVFALEFVPPWVKSYKSSRWRPRALPLSTSDPLVAAERERVLVGDTSQDVLVLKNLTKKYTSTQRFRHHLAVNQLSFGVHKKECFGLLGVNGAGKTSTFRMLTGDLDPSYGDALLNSQSVVRDRGHVQSNMGYCPQVDALIDQLTGREHLVLIGRLRGLHPPQLMEMVDWALEKLGLSRYADKPAGTYSGGNKRKLSTAIALLTSPPVILLDEPTSGVDPHARHFLWDIVKNVTSSGHSVVLTTHSMAECEALCSRVGIMVNGSFRCLGTPQQLKSSYGGGYKVKVRTKGLVGPVKEFMAEHLGQAVLKEEHFSTLIYQIPTVDGHSLSQLFETMELGRTNLEILDYSVSQTTLDDVFIHFANQQSDGVPSSDGDDVAKGDLHGDGSDIAKEDLNGDVAQKDLRSDDTGLTGTKTEELKAKVNDGVKYTVANEGTTEVA